LLLFFVSCFNFFYRCQGIYRTPVVEFLCWIMPNGRIWTRCCFIWLIGVHSKMTTWSSELRQSFSCLSMLACMCACVSACINTCLDVFFTLTVFILFLSALCVTVVRLTFLWGVWYCSQCLGLDKKMSIQLRVAS